MLRTRTLAVAAIALAAPAFAQSPAVPAPSQAAAIVNGQPIPESAVQRGLKRVPPADHARARPDIINFLTDNLLIEQYLTQSKVDVTPAEVAAKLASIQAEVKKEGKEYAKMLQDLQLSEDDLKREIAADLRWEKFATAQATDANLKALYAQNPDVFNGSTVRARHILVTPPPGSDAKAVETVRAGLQGLKAQIDAGIAAEAAKASPSDPAARGKAAEAVFGKFAAVHSACPSKQKGGDLGEFPRMGMMVEPFAKAAFALPPYAVSEPVQTQFGFHLIMVTEKKAGQPLDFEKVKGDVRGLYEEKLRESLTAQLRQSAKIAVTPVK